MHKKSDPVQGFFNDGLAIGEVLHIDFNEKIRKIKGYSFSRIKYMIEDFKSCYAEHDKIVRKHGIKTEIEQKIHLAVQLITSDFRFYRDFKKNNFKKQMPLLQSYKLAFETSVKRHKGGLLDEIIAKGYKKEYEETLATFYEKSLGYIERFILSQVMKKHKKSHIITIENLRLEHLFDIPDNVSGIVFKRFEPQEEVDLRFTKIFDIPIVQYDFESEETKVLALSSYDETIIVNPTKEYRLAFEKIYQETRHIDFKDYDLDHQKIKMYAQCANKKNADYIAQNPFYEGLGIYQTEYDYLTFNMTFTQNHLEERYIDILKPIKALNKEIIFSLPDIREDKDFYLPNNITLDLIDLENYPGMFMSQIEAIATAAKRYDKVGVAIPMIYEASEIDAWRHYICSAFEYNGGILPKIGIMLETDSMFEHIEDLENEDVDFVIIGFNDLFSDLHDIDRYESVDIKKFKKYYYEELRDIHSYFLSMKIRHICMGNVLSNPEILHKLMKMGFREFSITKNNEMAAYEILKTRQKNKGRYIGVLKQQIELRDYRRAIFEATGKKPPNRRLNPYRRKPKKDDENNK